MHWWCANLNSHCAGWSLLMQFLKFLFLVTKEKHMDPDHHSLVMHHSSGQPSGRTLGLLSVEGAEMESHCSSQLGKPKLFLLLSVWPGARLLRTTAIHPGTDPDGESTCVQARMVLNLLVVVTEVIPGPFNDLTACTMCIMHIETKMMQYTNECCSGKDMCQFYSSKLKLYWSNC